MNFNQDKENKILQLTSKYNDLLSNLNASPFLEKLSKLDLSKLSSNKRVDFLVNENLQLQDNIEFLQKKINEKLIGLEKTDGNKNNLELPLKEINDDFKRDQLKESQDSQMSPVFRENIDFLKNEIISLNNVLIQINGNINNKLDSSIKELTSMYESVRNEVESLSNNENKMDLQTLSAKEISDEISQSLNHEIKRELIFLKDNFDKKLAELKDVFEPKNFVNNESLNHDDDFTSVENNQVDINEDNYDSNDLINDNNFKSTSLHSYYNDEINLKKRDLEQIFGESGKLETKRSYSSPIVNPASIDALEKNVLDVNLKLDKILIDSEKQKSNIEIEKKYINATTDVETKWNNIVTNMEQDMQLIIEENKFLKSQFDDLQVKYVDLKKEYIEKNDNFNNVEKVLSVMNHKFNELSKILDQQDVMMKSLQAENMVFFEKLNSRKIINEHISENVYDDANENKSNDLVSSNLKNLENKLMNIQYELSKIENDDFDSLINEYKDKVI